MQKLLALSVDRGTNFCDSHLDAEQRNGMKRVRGTGGGGMLQTPYLFLLRLLSLHIPT